MRNDCASIVTSVSNRVCHRFEGSEDRLLVPCRGRFHVLFWSVLSNIGVRIKCTKVQKETGIPASGEKSQQDCVFRLAVSRICNPDKVVQKG